MCGTSQGFVFFLFAHSFLCLLDINVDLLTVYLHCLSTETTLDYKTKIAIVATVASMVALLAGGTPSMFYCKRKNFRGRQKASVIQDRDNNRL